MFKKMSTRKNNDGKKMFQWAKDLFPLNRSLTGNGTRKTLRYIKKIIPEMKIIEVPSGTKAFDWTIPNEWNVKEAWIKNKKGEKICNFSECNLHLMGYSIPIKKTISLKELQNHLYSLPNQPNAIPYVTSYYKKNWGFCLKHNDRKKLISGDYEVCIDSNLSPGHLTYGEVILPGKKKKEIFLSTYICHPSLANNELSGPVVTTAITESLKQLGKKREYSYRIIFIPETIGAIFYLSKHYQKLKKIIDAGFVLTCLGDDNSYSMVESRYGNTLADKVAKHVLKHKNKKYTIYPFLDRGSDVRQYSAPGIDLPVCELMRSKYDTYKEYHTSLDNLNYISEKGLKGGFEIIKRSIEILEKNNILKTNILCEPQLSKRGLYPNISIKDSDKEMVKTLNFLAYCDGTKDLIEIAEKININAYELIGIMEKLIKKKVISIIKK